MKILLVNWQQGENNPFDYFNSKLKEKFELLGCSVSKIDLDNDFISNIKSHSKFDLAITWQGLGSNVNAHGGGNLWEGIEIPLICLHGDHPCHMPINHMADNSFVHHIYAAPSFAKYSNENIKKASPALYCMLPNIFHSVSNENSRGGDFLVFPKNLDPIDRTLKAWKERLKPITAGFLFEAYEKIKSDYDLNIYKDHHLSINELLTAEKLDQLRLENNISNNELFFHNLHALLDKVYRNYASEQVVKSLKDYPLKIYGRGWDEFKNRNNNHEFFGFDSVSDGDFQFYSNFGVIDIAPSVDSLHDRLFRACAHNGSFISNSLLNYSLLFDRKFDNVFYRMNGNNIVDSVERIIASPQEHLDICRNFSLSFDHTYSFYEFYLFISRFTRC